MFVQELTLLLSTILTRKSCGFVKAKGFIIFYESVLRNLRFSFLEITRHFILEASV